MKKDLRKFMPAQNKTTVFMSGTFYWAKVLGEPRLNYGGDAKEWSFEFEPDAKSVALLKKHKLSDRLKDKYEDRGPYITLRKRELGVDGKPNDPIRVLNSENETWDNEQLIGNGSKGDLKVDIRDYGPGKKAGIYPQAIRINEHVAYQSTEFGAMDKAAEDEEDAPKASRKAAAKKDTFREDFGLDDEIPFGA